jgi:predicted transcriptional regulator
MTPTDFRAARKTLGLTQSAWASWLGISLSHCKALESGAANVTPTVSILVRLYLAGTRPLE